MSNRSIKKTGDFTNNDEKLMVAKLQEERKHIRQLTTNKNRQLKKMYETINKKKKSKTNKNNGKSIVAKKKPLSLQEKVEDIAMNEPPTDIDLNLDFTNEKLCKVIDHMLRKKSEKPSSLIDREYLESILSFLSITCKVDSNLDLDITTEGQDEKYILELLKLETDLLCLKLMLQRWSIKHFNKKIPIIFDESKLSVILYNDLQSHYRNITKYKNEFINIIAKKNNLSLENVIRVSCSLKKIQNLLIRETFFSNCSNSIPEYNYCDSDVPSFKEIFNWPHIRTRFKLKLFTMAHANVNVNKFSTVITSGMLTSIDPQSTKLHFKSTQKPSTYSSDFILKFLTGIKEYMWMKDIGISHERKQEISEMLSQLIMDVSLFPYTIDTNTYYLNLNSHPYVRYFDQIDNPFDSEMKIQQICYPRVSFVLENVNIYYSLDDKITRFKIDKAIDEELVNCLSFKCTLCNTELGSTALSEDISKHILLCQGAQPNWKCTNCNKYFSTKGLSIRRWAHDCDAT